ncbi:glucose-6-phosphate isomerase [Haloechinothrix sp. LS1_15]|uniref:glucose-6-phosphate isomerase n=1 Tax=Haloechinothrix sp. LS1_15 TaxID=2652248 RepID=UPI0029456130|nr:glucose-6-phosphate isomerase [Haloechinothrix sp. LS1_15]MDV6013234.1 glucose-6-phosphate isomerase [Haloechinothrix sp. LS1_15]
MGEVSEINAVTIASTGLDAAAQPLIAELVTDRVASRLTAQDPGLWGEQARDEAAIRLGWTALHQSSRPLIGEIATLREQLLDEGIDRVVLAGMGGSSLAPEVIAKTEGVALTVLDTTDPGQVADALAGELARTVLVVSSKSGGTVETDSHRRVFVDAFAEEGIDPASRIIVVTDPGTPLAELAEREGYRRAFLADPHVGGRYSALSAFGLVPAGLAGADIARMLDQAAAAAEALSADSPDNPAHRLAAALAAAHLEGAEKVVLTNSDLGGPGALTGFGDWIEQLLAESTGKQGTGLLPVVVESIDAPAFQMPGSDATPVAIGPARRGAAVATEGPLGAQFLLWEYATAIVGRLLGVNPFDQPDVEAAKQAARALLDSGDSGDADAASGARAGETPLLLAVGAVEVYGNAGTDATPDDLDGVLRTFLATVRHGGYLAVHAYLDRLDDASASLLRPELARRVPAHVTFGWGPRFLHSTGQYHKGGHPNGSFLQITGQAERDLAVPGMPYTLGELQLAQAVGDGRVLTERGFPVLRLHLTDRAAGLAQLIRAIEGL